MTDKELADLMTEYFNRSRRGRGWDSWAADITAKTGTPLTAFVLRRMAQGSFQPTDYELMARYFSAVGEIGAWKGFNAARKQINAAA